MLTTLSLFRKKTDNSLPLASLFFLFFTSHPRTGKQFSSCWPVLALPEDIQGPTTELLVAFCSLIFKMDDEAPCPPSCLFLFFFLSLFPLLCRDAVGGRLHSCSGRRLSLHKCPSFISQAEGRLYRSGWLTITAAGVGRHMTLPHSLKSAMTVPCVTLNRCVAPW